MRYALLVTILLLSTSSFAQMKIEPYIFSDEVQRLAQDRRYFKDRILLELMTSGGQPQPTSYQTYLDTLSAVDVIAKERKRQSNRKDQDKDYPIAFSVVCWWPNKPPVSADVTGYVAEVRAGIRDSYLSSQKRELLFRALRPVLLRGSESEVYEALKTASSYQSLLLDHRVLLLK